MDVIIAIGIVFLVFASFIAGFYGSEFMLTLEEKKQMRHKERFDWYRRMGLYESAALTELVLAKAYWMPYKI